MSGARERRAGRFFPSEAHELRQIARRIKIFGLPGPTVSRAVDSIREIADRIDDRAEVIVPGTRGRGGSNPQHALAPGPVALSFGEFFSPVR